MPVLILIFLFSWFYHNSRYSLMIAYKWVKKMTDNDCKKSCTIKPKYSL